MLPTSLSMTCLDNAFIHVKGVKTRLANPALSPWELEHLPKQAHASRMVAITTSAISGKMLLVLVSLCPWHALSRDMKGSVRPDSYPDSSVTFGRLQSLPLFMERLPVKLAAPSMGCPSQTHAPLTWEVACLLKKARARNLPCHGAMWASLHPAQVNNPAQSAYLRASKAHASPHRKTGALMFVTFGQLRTARRHQVRQVQVHRSMELVSKRPRAFVAQARWRPSSIDSWSRGASLSAASHMCRVSCIGSLACRIWTFTTCLMSWRMGIHASIGLPQQPIALHCPLSVLEVGAGEHPWYGQSLFASLPVVCCLRLPLRCCCRY